MVTTAREPPTASFILSLIAGILILGGGGMMTMMGAWYTPYGYRGGMMGGYYGMMGGYYGMMGLGPVWYFAIAAITAVSGIVVLLGAVLLFTQPLKASTWGSLIIAFSVVSFLGMGGFFVGAVLGLVGGILAITYRP